MSHQSHIFPDTYYYLKEQDKLVYIKETRARKYFDGDDWTWEEWPVLEEITDKARKKVILQEHPWLL